MSEDLLSTVTDLVAGGATSLPAPIRRNALKAFDQLCTAFFDLPVAYLEGKAAEMRAETQARVKLINDIAAQMASQINLDSQYAYKAVSKYAEQILQEQLNLDKVCEIAAQEIYSTSEKAEEKENDGEADISQISDDWLNEFRKEACGKSSEEMQILFGKILAGEIKQPDSFSIRTIRIMGQLDSKTAKLFCKACSLAMSITQDISSTTPNTVPDSRVPSLGRRATANGLADYELSYANLIILQEAGLIIPDLDSSADYRFVIAHNNIVDFALKYCNSYWGLVPTNSDDWQPDKSFYVNGVALTNSGKELLKIVEIEPDEKYTSELSRFFSDRGFTLTAVSGTR